MRGLLKISTTLLATTALNMSYAQASEVELIDAFNINMSHDGMNWYNESFTVAVDNLSPTKQVFIRQEKKDGSWIDIPMSFVKASGEEKEYWRATSDKKDNGTHFVVGMTIDGNTYWDNNNGENYKLLDEGYLLGKDKQVVVDGYYKNTDELRVNIVVNNLSPTKNVELIYTTDNWQSSHNVKAQYGGNPVIFGYGSYANPNTNNVESWKAVLPMSRNEYKEFYISYTANGRTYYDNNYGVNYKVNEN